MTEREELLRRLERVKALAERGVGGEKENAEALLNRLMAKYGISEEDIEDTAERDYFIRYHNFWERKLIVQIAYKHLGSGHCCGTVGTQSGRPHKKICVTCTPAQYIEIEADFEFYKAAWEEELAIFYSAFISKNDIFPPPELASPSDDDEIDLVRLEKVRAMMSGIDRRTRSKALPGSMEDDDDESLMARFPIGYGEVTGSRTSSIPAQRMITISFMRRSGTIWFLCESRISI